jgi:hypothetical protein
MSQLVLYRLDRTANLVIEPNAEAWTQWMLDYENRKILYTELATDLAVSTVFLGLNVGTDNKPRLFDTRILGGPLDDDCTFSESYHEACMLHDITVERAKAARRG